MNFYLVNRFHLDPAHGGRNRVPAIARQAVHARAYQELGAAFLRGAKQFVNVALAISDVNATDGSSSRLVDCFRFSSQRTLSLASMGTRVGFTGVPGRCRAPLNNSTHLCFGTVQLHSTPQSESWPAKLWVIQSLV